MDTTTFDRLTKALAGRLSRRGLAKAAAAGSAAGPAAALLAAAAAADGDKDKDKNKAKDKGDDTGRCRAAGEACAGGQPCCGGLTCQGASGGDWQCLPPGAGTGAETMPAAQTTVTEPAPSTKAGPAAPAPAGGIATFPQVVIDVDCTYDAPAFQTVCVALGGAPEAGPAVTDILLPVEGVCAVTIDRTFRPPRFEEVVVRKPAPAGGGGGQASAGNGGIANADASGGTVSIGDVNSGGNRGGDNETNVNADASGGAANADASGGDGNVAVAGGDGGGAAEEVVRELRQVEPASLTVVLEGDVAPGGAATWWVETEQGRFPAKGPALGRVADTTPAGGSVAVAAFACPDGAAEADGDWFGRCADPAAPFGVTLTPVEPAGAAATRDLNALGRTRFAGLAPGRYRLDAADGAWCRAESDAVNEAGEVVVEAGRESNVWLFTCPAA